MGVFTHGDQALEWRGGQEIVRIEPWGPGSLRVRGTVWEKIRDDLPGALIPWPWAGPGCDRDGPAPRGSPTAA